MLKTYHIAWGKGFLSYHIYRRFNMKDVICNKDEMFLYKTICTYCTNIAARDTKCLS